MTEKINSRGNRGKFSSLMGIVSAVWGIGITSLFLASQIRMDFPGTPMSILEFDSGGLLFLGFHLAAFILLLLIAFSSLNSKSQNPVWSWLVIGLSIILIGVCLIPGSTIGFPLLPGAVGMLVSGLLWSLSRKQ